MAKSGTTRDSVAEDEQVSMSYSKEKQVSRSPNQLPAWIVAWFYATAVICTWDASFIVCRPYSMPGQSLAWIWYLYKYYVTVDQRYSDIGDAYVYAQSLLNYAEVLLNVIALIMHYRQSKHTVPTAFMVSVMTMWKTVLYFLMFSDLCTGSEYRRGNTLVQEIFILVIPNIFWISLPSAAMIQLWSYITPVEKSTSYGSWENGEALSNDCFSESRSQQRGLKREVLRGPGSGFVQSGKATEDISEINSLSWTYCMRQRTGQAKSAKGKN
ncbi:emopamil-binding protein [Elysia marginata]|uniref:Emopamil-binding protein n=1 Tax=Elysia marginata TaxID=1093978 RepID=A0AAV4HSU9_9GAST|nr:emopamil-binding protein [Elysia marginata]